MDWQVIPDNLGFLLKGLAVTLQLALMAMVLSFPLGTLAAMARLARRPWLHWPAVLYIELVRGVPLIMVIFWFYFFLPIFTGRPLDNFTSALVAFIIFEGAYMAEIIRAGIQSVPRGQVDASLSTSLTTLQMMRYVILPQAFRNMLPSLVTQFIILFKDTSLAYIIGVIELTRAASIVSQREIRPFELYVFIAVVYWVFTFALSRLSRLLEIRLSHRA